MRRVFLFVVPILILVTLVFVVFGILQAKIAEERLFGDLKREAKIVADGMELSVKNILLDNDLRSARRLVEKFQKRERLQGCAIYNKDAKTIAITERFSEWEDREKPHIKEVLFYKKTRGGIEKFKEYSVYSYSLPVLTDDGEILGIVEVIYDTSYVFTSLAALWRRLSVALTILVVLILTISLIMQRHIFVLPVQRLTEWFTHFHKGEIDANHPIKDDAGVLGKLASEVEQAALHLRVAKKSMSDKAQATMHKEGLWTEEKLKNLVRAKLGMNSLVVVSNREPYMHVIDEAFGTVKCVRPASGVVTAIDAIMRTCGGTWVANGAGNADKKYVNSKNKLGVPPEDHKYILKRVWFTKEEEQGYYFGFSNEGLWPLCHITHTRPIFRDSDWNMYKKVNQKFADAIIEELPNDSPYVFIQDYHFTVLAKQIKEKRPDATIALFWHIPWPNPESFSICPYQKEILEGMLACDLLGFHVQEHCNNFLETVNKLLESRVDTAKFTVVRSGKESYIKAFPISVPEYIGDDVNDVAQKAMKKIRKEFDLEDKIIGVGVDRIDYTKGIKERIFAIDRFLEKNPEYKGRFVFIQLAAPSRSHIKRYHDLMGEIDELVEKKNWKYSDGNWKPIIYLRRQFSSDEIIPYFALADLCIVSSLHDGMNLVAKEYVAARNDLGGSLILSRFTGAARELTDAIHINPYAIGDFADAIKLAIEMPEDEKRQRMKNMRKVIRENNVYRWAGDIISELTALKKK